MEEVNVVGIVPHYPPLNIYTNAYLTSNGLLSVLSPLKSNKRINNIYVLDENNYNGPTSSGMPNHASLNRERPAKIAMFYGGLTNAATRLYSLVKEYKKMGAVTIAGGPHVDTLPIESLKSGIDIVVHGEGEATVEEIINNIIEDGRVVLDSNKLSNIPGISYLDEEGVPHFTGRREPVPDIDRFEPPDFDLLKLREKEPSAHLVSWGKGCNFRCEFCVVRDLYGKHRAHSIDYVMEQMKRQEKFDKYPVRFFTDDNFAMNPKAAIELCRRMEAELGNGKNKSRYGRILSEFNGNVGSMVQVRTEAAENDELLDALLAANIRSLAIGYESPIDEELKEMNKKVTYRQELDRSRKLVDRGFFIHGMFIFGYPICGESKQKSSLTLEERADKYRKFFKESGISTVQVLNTIPLPGTDLRRNLEKEGRILPGIGWERLDGQFLCHDPTPEGIDPIELQEMALKLMTEVYIGSPLNRILNKNHWMNWVMAPFQASGSATAKLFENIYENMRGNKKELLYPAVERGLENFKKHAKDLIIKNSAKEIINKWSAGYKETGHREILLKCRNDALMKKRKLGEYSIDHTTYSRMTSGLVAKK